jgi:hypothetical protein
VILFLGVNKVCELTFSVPECRCCPVGLGKCVKEPLSLGERRRCIAAVSTRSVRASETRPGEAVGIAGKGIDAWHDAICQVQSKSGESGRYGS